VTGAVDQPVTSVPAPPAPVRRAVPPDPTGHERLVKAATLTWTLAITDWKLKFYGSALGYAWTLVKPFAFFGVLYFVFTQIANLNADVPHYGVYILFAMVLFNFFADVTGGCVTALPVRENLLRKMQFPPIVIPLAIAVTGLLNLGMTLVAVVIFALLNGVYPEWSWLEFPILVLLLTVLSVGVGMLLSALYPRFRDIAPIWDVVSQILFYASAILYVYTTIPEQYQRWFLINPLAACMTEMRHVVIDPSAPSIFEAMPDGRWLVPLGIVLVAFAIGLRVFLRESPRVAERL